jgi:2',3'-cyclic-nucleotide 2'-phosphodiesterase (5'-nucleotidase family)
MRANRRDVLARCTIIVIALTLCTRLAAAQSDGAVMLSVITTNDVHGRLAQLPLLGGYVRNLRAARAADAGAVLLLDAGDIFQGTLESNSTEGAAMIRGYRALGYSAAAIGNHEFDFGPVGPHPIPLAKGEDPLGALKARVREAPFPMLCANLRRSDGKAPPCPGLRASVMLRPAGVRVGIVGGLTKNALIATHAANTRDLQVTPLADAIAREARALRKAGARVVIAVVHAGGDCHDARDPDDLSSCDADAEVFELARALPAALVDLIVAGHTHAQLAHRVNGIPITEAYSNGHAFGRADVSVPRDPRQTPSVRIYPPHRLCEDTLDKPVCTTESYEGSPVVRDERVLLAIASDLARAKVEREQPLGVQVSAPITRASTTESALNNLVADLILQAAPGADAAFSNAGGVRISLPTGPLTYGTVYEMFPFDNSFATLHISAGELAGIIATNLAAEGGILSLAGLRARARCAEGRLMVDISTSQGQLLPPDRKLTVITSDFLASQGDGILGGLALGPDRLSVQRERLIRSALVDGLRAYPGGRIDGNDKRLFDPSHPRIAYAGTRPLSCGRTGQALVP